MFDSLLDFYLWRWRFILNLAYFANDVHSPWTPRDEIREFAIFRLELAHETVPALSLFRQRIFGVNLRKRL